MSEKPDYSSFFYLNPLPSWVYDLKTFQVLDVNQAAIDHYGYTKAEFLELTIKDLRPEEEIPKLLSAHADIEKQVGNIYFGVFNHKKKNGDLIRMEINGHKADYLVIESMIVVAKDVTEEEAQIKNLKLSEERLQAATSIAKLGYWRLELDAKTLSWTDEIFNIWGRERYSFELNYEDFLATIHPDDRELFTQEQNASFAGEKEHNIVHRIILPDNSIRWVHELGRLAKDENGKPVAFEGTVQDITGRKEEEERLKLLESVITNTNDAVMITHADPVDEPGPRIVYVNEAFTKMTGYTSEDLIGKTPRILQGPKSDRDELARLKTALINWESCEITTINYKKNGDEFWVNLSVSPVANEKGWYTHFIAIERDVTEQKNKEREKELLGKISLNFSIDNNLRTSADELCKTISEFGEFDFVELWLPNIENTQIQLLAHKTNTANAETFYEWSKDVKYFHTGEGLPGIVWLKKSIILWDDISKNVDFIRKEAAEQAGIQTALGIPLLFNKNCVGVLVIGAQNGINFLKKYVTVFEQLEQFIGSEINRKKLENDLIHLYESIPDIVCVADFHGRFLKMNPSGCHLLGYTEEEILYHSFDEFVFPADKDISAQEVAKLGKGHSVFSFENRYVQKNGELCWLSWTCNANLQEGIIYATARNITGEKKLRELNNVTSKMARIGSWEVDLQKNKVFYSEMVHQLHETDPQNYEPGLTEGINFYREDFRPMVTEAVNQCIQSGTPFDFEAVLVTANKSELWVRVIGNAELLNGECIRIYGSFQDIHERKEADLRLLSLADNLPGVVFQFQLFPDGTSKFLNLSKAVEKLYGFDAELIMKNNALLWDQVEAGGDIDKVQASIGESLATLTNWHVIYRNKLPNGKIIWLEGWGTPRRLADGSTIWDSIVLDITDLKETEQLLDSASKLARVGSWEIDLQDNEEFKLFWSGITKNILEIDESFEPTIADGINFYKEHSRSLIEAAVNKAIETGQAFDLELELVSGKGNDIWIRCIGDAQFENGKVTRIYGSFQDINTRKVAELNQLKLNEEKSKILESISDYFYALDGELNFTYMNSSCANLIQDKKGKIIGKNLFTEFPYLKNTQFEDELRKVQNTAEATKFEFYYAPFDTWFEESIYPTPAGISVYFVDINQRKKANAEIAKSEEKRRLIMNGALDAIITIDTNETITFWNAQAEVIFGWKAEEVMGKALSEMIIPEPFRKYHVEGIKNYLKTGEGKALNVLLELSAIRRNREEFPIELTVLPIKQGGEEFFCAFIRDITQRKRSEEKLKIANERFEKATEATSDVIWDWDIVNKTFYRSKGIEKFFGEHTSTSFSEDEFWNDKFLPEYLPAIIESVTNAINDPLCSRWEMEYKVYNVQGETVDVMDRGVILRDSNGNATRMVGAMTDFTERKNYENQLLNLNQSIKQYAHQLELTNEELEQFAFVASHDLQEPLRMISSFLDQLKKKYENQLDDKAHRYIHFATDGAKRMKQIILDLLDYSRSGKLLDSTEEVDLNEILEQYTSLRRKIIAEKNAKINISQLPVIKSYKVPLTQTLHCLLDNAIKYSSKDTPPLIEISAKEAADSWMICIADNGIGIDPKFFEKIFIIFQRLHNRDEYNGTGIGLSIAKKQTESWGGKIWLESEPGKGSIFYFTHPKEIGQS